MTVEVPHGGAFGPNENALAIIDAPGGAFLRLPGELRDKEALLSVIHGVKGGWGASISAGELHLPGPEARYVLARLAVVWQLLRALDVQDEKTALDILRATPALMADSARQGASFTVHGGRARLNGNARWLQAVIADLACHFPRLACRIFLDLLGPRARWTLLSHHPSTFDALVARVDHGEDRHALQVYFEDALASEMKEPRGAPYMAVWMARCPPWAEASLHRIWSTLGDESTKRQWEGDCPALAEILVRWKASCPPMSKLRIDELDRLRPLRVDPAASVQADRSFICQQFTQILHAPRGRHDVRDLRYGEALAKCGLPSRDEEGRAARTRFLFHCALSALAESWKAGRVENEALEWLLARLFKAFPSDFSAMAACAVAHVAANPLSKQLPLSAGPEDPAVAYADHVQAGEVVRRMIGWCHHESDFQSRLPLRQDVKRHLAMMAGEDLFVWLAPTGQKDGYGQASWKVQLLWRDEWLMDQCMPGDETSRSIATARILKLALEQEGSDGIQEQDLDDMASMLRRESAQWVETLLGLNPTFTAQQRFRALIARLAVKCASNAYAAADRERATEFIAMLCGCAFVFDVDLEPAAQSMTAGDAIDLEDIKQLQKALSHDPRGLERMYLWVYFLERSRRSDPGDRMAAALRYLADACEGFHFEHLNGQGLLNEYGPRVTALFARYRPDMAVASQVVEEEGGAFMRLSSAWQNEAFLSAFERVKGVQGQPWIAGGVLHLQGAQAMQALGRLAFALQVLAALGVRQDEEVLRVIVRTPTLMVQARPPGVSCTVTAGRPRLAGDVQWLQSVILDLASHAPSLACLVFLGMTPEGQWTMLTKYPPAFDVMAARIGDEVDRESLLAHFQGGLASEMKNERDPRRVEVWVSRCPGWAEAALHDILVDEGRQAADAWPPEHPKLRRVLQRWERAYAPKAAHGAEAIRPLKADPEPLLARYQPDAMLWRVRLAKYPAEGGLVWRTGVRYIRHQIHEILQGLGDPADRELRFGNAVETVNYLRRGNQADLFLSCAFVVLSSGLKNGAVHGEAQQWLLDKLYKNFARSFSIAAADSFTQHLPLLMHEDRRVSAPGLKCRMHVPWGGRFLAISFAHHDHVTQMLGHMMARCRADPAFQSRLRLQAGATQGLMKLSQSNSPGELLHWLGSTDPRGASWKIRLLSRERRSQSILQASDPTADILRSALAQEPGGIQEGDMDDLAAYLLHNASTHWIEWLLAQHPKEPRYRALVVGLIVKCASKAYDSNDRAATDLVALLCESKVVTGDDLRVAAPYMTAPEALGPNAVTELARVLSLSARAQERMCLWISHIVSSVRAGPAGEVARTVGQLDAAFRKSNFKHLARDDRDKVMALFERYRPQPQKRPT